MAQRSMFSKKITETDLFLDMPMSTQCLYFHLNMSADDDGFIGNAKTIRRMIGASEDDLKLLLAKEFLIPFDSGVVVVKDWKIHNYIRSDRYNETVYQEEKKQLKQLDNGRYEIGIPNVIPTVYQMDTQVRLGKDRLGKDKENPQPSDDGQSISERFEVLWKQYPKKQGKKKALTYYKRAIKNGVTDEEIMQGMEEYKKYLEKKKSWLNPMDGSRWFNEERWNDEFEETKSNDEISGLPTGSYDPLADVRDLEI